MAHLDFKLLRVLVVVIPQSYCHHVTILNKMGNMSCLRYLRLEGLISGKLPKSILKLRRLETLDFGKSFVRLPSGVWELKQLRHLRSGYFGASYGCFSISPFCPKNVYSLPNNLQTLMLMNDEFFELRLFHRVTNLRKLGIIGVSDSTITMLSIPSTVLLDTLEVLKLKFTAYRREHINLSSYQNIVKLHLSYLPKGFTISVAFPPNLVKLTLHNLMVHSLLLGELKKLPKLRILKMDHCTYHGEKMDLSGDANGDSFPQLEVLHIKEPIWLHEVTCTDDVSMPQLNKLLLGEPSSHIRLSERLAKLRK